MIKILTRSSMEYAQYPKEWKIGDEPIQNVYDIRDIVEIEADGDELRRILSECRHIPCTNSINQRWFGDMAQFIVANMCY